MKQLESYQAHRQQNCLPQVHLKIFNIEKVYLEPYMDEKRAQGMMEKSLLTGE